MILHIYLSLKDINLRDNIDSDLYLLFDSEVDAKYRYFVTI